MKKLNFTFLLILCFALLNIGLASSQIRFGLRGGFDVSNNRINKDILNASNRLGPQVGGVVEIMAPIIGWGAEAGVIYGMQQFNVTDKDYDIKNYHYLRVPVNLKKKFSIVGLFGVFIVVGPYAEFRLSGGEFSSSVIDQYKSKSFGMGFDAGAGVELLKHLEIGMYYRKALTENYSTDFDGRVRKRPSNWAVNLTYFF
ncbi:outer membrane protein with beta-barrel domain [Dysgonomonas alginatilytica]|uniref:Outer membrane protein with beta-barrel domain n=1 Tax=Dysgonomonas alginatilytica TaxID=1605892 RepID=A0A2V3PLE9_9BACT|nr:porin family protein [Dysgonomonas alginatilytica]PXV62055.1 outer membrane protein with beta-barrel domain [Dysgonomonas alginatilytica]